MGKGRVLGAAALVGWMVWFDFRCVFDFDFACRDEFDERRLILFALHVAKNGFIWELYDDFDLLSGCISGGKLRNLFGSCGARVTGRYCYAE